MTKKTMTIKILVVDDEDEFREAASKALLRQGFEVALAADGQQALEHVGEAPPDLVVLDLKMEGLDGIATLEQLRKTLPDLPVIILTGHGRYEDALAGIKLEVVEFLQKPVDMKQLGALIRNLFEKGHKQPMREKTIQELMVPLERYRRVYADQSIRDAVAVLQHAGKQPVEPEDPDRGRRTLLVYDRQENFVGLLRAEDIVRIIVPDFLQESPYSSYFTGMFLAQTKILGKLPIIDIIQPLVQIQVDVPLMEAVHRMVSENLRYLMVFDMDRVVGILRPDDIYTEIATPLLSE